MLPKGPITTALHRVPDTCATLDELQEQTRLLYLSITAEARRAKAAAKRTHLRALAKKGAKVR
jgi:hypothetical protein